jgi:hypothetical protein
MRHVLLFCIDTNIPFCDLYALPVYYYLGSSSLLLLPLVYYCQGV